MSDIVMAAFDPFDILGKRKKQKKAAPVAPFVKKVTAKPARQLSEEAQRNRRRKSSLLTKDFGRPTLGQSVLLGVQQ